ncbi:HMA2 domain-containing protein [Treponema primitia]|uniref:HMA2 domain-containing protein n=1 Tax=Treponema primitia TaxID=88058 RepID=UPI00025550DF|nr:ATPase P [Treponema primitia]
MIVSYSPGRIRLRFKELRDPKIAELASKRIENTPGITRVEIKPLTGSLLIEFDIAVLPPAELMVLGKQELEKLGIHLELPDQFKL